MKYTKPRGTEDWILDQAQKYYYLQDLLFRIAKNNGYQPIKTPIFESAELFIRSVGQNSDIVKKEFYEFNDKSNRKLVLRPENTASVIRCIVEEKLLNKLPPPLRFCYFGPMFRYERPQSGRLREFNQFGVECIKSQSICDDVDLIIFANSILNNLGVKNYTININNIGNFESRSKWIDALKKYFKKYENELSDLSKERLNSNPLRILDDKIDGKKSFVQNAPKILDFLSQQEISDFEQIIKLLENNGIKINIDPTLVRGLDYYTNLVFEINSTDKRLDAQPTIIGGGRYAKLVNELGGEDCSCLGFALGVERLLLVCEYENIQLLKQNNIDVVIACLTNDATNKTFEIMKLLRKQNIKTICKFDNSKLSKILTYANNVKAKFIIIIGEQEMKNNSFVVKNLDLNQQRSLSMNEIIDFIKG